MSIKLKGIFMMPKLLEAGCLRGSTKPISDSLKGAHLSITFLTGRSPVGFQFFLEGHEAMSKMFLEHLTCNSNFYPSAKNACVDAFTDRLWATVVPEFLSAQLDPLFAREHEEGG